MIENRNTQTNHSHFIKIYPCKRFLIHITSHNRRRNTAFVCPRVTHLRTPRYKNVIYIYTFIRHSRMRIMQPSHVRGQINGVFVL